MSLALFGVLFVASAAALAAWVQVRFPSLEPEQAKARLVHLLLSAAIVQVAVPTLLRLVAPESRELVLVVLVGVALPALAYAFLSILWLIKVAHSAMAGRFH